jgi:recombination protein RecT
MGQLVRLDKRADLITQLFNDNRKRMLSATPKSTGDPLRIFNVAYNLIAYNPDLLDCTQESLVGGVFEALKLGITLGGPMQEGWLIPFKRNATLIVGYMGYRNIIDRAGSVIDMHPRAVHNGRYRDGKEWKQSQPDEFDYWLGDNPRIIHKPRNAQPEFREQLQAVYIVANLRRGGRQSEVLLLDEVDAHRARSRAKDSGPWVTDFVPMALKTGVRKISKYLPKSNELLARALDLDEKADLGKDQEFEIPPGVVLVDEGDPTKKPAGSPMDRLKQHIGVPTVDGRTDDQLEKDAEGGDQTATAEISRRNRELDRQIAEREQ